MPAINGSNPCSRFAWRRSRWFALFGLLQLNVACGSSGSHSGGAPAAGGSPGGGGAGMATGGSAGTGGGAVASGGGSSSGMAGALGGDAGSQGCLEPDAPLTNDDDPTAMPAADPALAGAVHHFFKIVVKDAASKAPIPGATLTTVNDIPWQSDQKGVVAFYEPGMMGESVYFAVSHPGYEYPADAFGGHGKALAVSEGGTVDLLLNNLKWTRSPGPKARRRKLQPASLFVV